MDTVPQPKKRPHSVANPDDKFFFCHYANMATHNAYMIIKDITGILKDIAGKALGADKEEMVRDDKLWDAALLHINPKKYPDVFAHAVALLQKRIPCVAFLVEQQQEPEKTMQHLRNLLQDLHEHRNFFSHYYNNETVPAFKKFGVDGQFTVNLMYLLRQAVKAARDRFKKGLPEAEQEQIEKNFSELYDAVHKKDELKRNFLNLSQPENLTKRTVFFLSMFLERKHANELISRIYGLRSTETKQRQATREAFLELCCTLPYPRLESSDIILDSLNELNKIPSPLYHAITNEHKKKFWYDEPKETTPEEEEVTAVLKRHEDRFPYLALRFFDQCHYIPGMMFQVYLGQLCTKKYEKIINGTKYERRIVKDLSTFGKLNDYEEKTNMPACWLREQKKLVATDAQVANPDDKGMKIEVEKELVSDVYFAPQYQITNGNIGFIFEEENASTTWHLWYKDTKTNKLEMFKKSPLSKGIKPFAVMSVMELQNLFLYAWLNNRGKIETDPKTYITQYVTNINQCIRDVKKGVLLPVSAEQYQKIKCDGKTPQTQDHKKLMDRVELLRQALEAYQIKPSDLPDCVREYLLGYSPAPLTKQLIEKIEYHKAATWALIDESKAQEKLEKGKRKRGLTAGKIGTYLAHDLITFKRGGKKPNDLQYNVLQSYIAFFGRDIHQLNSFLIEMKFVTGDDKHLFMKSLEEYATKFKKRITEKNNKIRGPITYGVKKFYEDYLYDKVRFLGNVLEQLNSGSLPKDDQDVLMVIFKIKERTPANWNYEDLHIRLPRGIFNKPIADALKNEMTTVGNHTAINPSFAIKNLFPELQHFYSYPRSHNYKNCSYNGDAGIALKEIRKDITHYEKIKHPTEAEEEQLNEYKDFYNIVEDNEKLIRHYQTCDRVLWQMLKIYFNEKGGNYNTMTRWKLNEIGADLEDAENVLDREIDITHNVNGKEVNGKKIYARLPIKRYGEFRRLLKDRRLPNLFTWLTEDSLPKSALDIELEEYDRRRSSLMELMFNFEKKAGALLTEQEKSDLLQLQIQRKKDLPFLDHLSYLSAYSAKMGVVTTSIDTIIELRDHICHNDYPPVSLFSTDVVNEFKYLQKEFEDNNEKKIAIFTFIANYINNIYENELGVVKSVMSY